jgi:hypothetical protein
MYQEDGIDGRFQAGSHLMPAVRSYMTWTRVPSLQQEQWQTMECTCSSCLIEQRSGVSLAHIALILQQGSFGVGVG